MAAKTVSEKVKSAPKELARRGLESGVDRLRGQLRDAAQQGQRDAYGGDALEDTGAEGFRRGIHGMERLLKGRKNRRRDSEGRAAEATAPASAPDGAPKIPPPKVKTRETNPARTPAENGTGDGGHEPAPGRRQPRAGRPGGPSTTQWRMGDGGGHMAPERAMGSSTQPASPPTPQERGRQVAKAQARQRAERANRQAGAPASVQTAPRDARPQPPEGGRWPQAAPGTSRQPSPSGAAPQPVGKPAGRAGAPSNRRKAHPLSKGGRQVKTVRRSSAFGHNAARPAQRQAQAAAKASAMRSAHKMKRASRAAVTGVERAKTAAKAAQAVVHAARGVLAAIAAGGSVVVSIVVVLCLVGVLLASPLGILFSGGGSGPDTDPPSTIVAQINGELAERLEQMRLDAGCDRLEITGAPPPWSEVLAVFAAKQSVGDGSGSLAVLDASQIEALRTVFWDMTKLTSEEKTVEHPATDTTAAWTETVLAATITPRTPDDMRVFYSFTAEQNKALDELLANGDLLTALAGDLTITDQTARDLLAALPPDLSPERRAVVRTACQLVGKVHYFWGGKSLKLGWDDRWGTLRQVTAAGSSTSGTYRPFGMDCSGFVDWVFCNTTSGTYVISHGGGAHAQHTYCTPISWSEALPGDLVFYPGDEHVGIVGGRDEAGNLLIVHCASSQNNVVITGKSGFTSIGRPVYYSE